MSYIALITRPPDPISAFPPGVIIDVMALDGTPTKGSIITVNKGSRPDVPPGTQWEVLNVKFCADETIPVHYVLDVAVKSTPPPEEGEDRMSAMSDIDLMLQEYEAARVRLTHATTLDSFHAAVDHVLRQGNVLASGLRSILAANGV